MVSDKKSRAEPRWPAVIAMIAVVALRFSLPQALRVGPDWILAPVVGLLLVSAVILHKCRRYRASQILGYILLAIVTADMIARLVLRITRLPEHRDTPRQLFTAALGIWCSNVLIFASWYWRLDGGGPNARDRRKSTMRGLFSLRKCRCQIRTGSLDLLSTSFWHSTQVPPFRQQTCQCCRGGQRR
jgi:hypothetical protein